VRLGVFSGHPCGLSCVVRTGCVSRGQMKQVLISVRAHPSGSGMVATARRMDFGWDGCELAGGGLAVWGTGLAQTARGEERTRGLPRTDGRVCGGRVVKSTECRERPYQILYYTVASCFLDLMPASCRADSDGKYGIIFASCSLTPQSLCRVASVLHLRNFCATCVGVLIENRQFSSMGRYEVLRHGMSMLHPHIISMQGVWRCLNQKWCEGALLRG